MPPATLADFRAKLHQELILPSLGLAVTVRRPDVEIFIGLGELPLPSSRAASPTGQAPEGTNRLSLQEINRYVERVIAEGIIEPPFSDARDAQGKPIYSQYYMHASELSKEDKTFLADILFGLMGLTPEVARAVEAFLPDALSPDDTEPSAGILDPAV